MNDREVEGTLDYVLDRFAYCRFLSSFIQKIFEINLWAKIYACFCSSILALFVPVAIFIVER